MNRMTLRSRSAVLLALGLVFSVATAGGLYLIASGRQPVAPAATPTPDTATVVAAATDIPARTVISAAMLKATRLPLSAIPAAAAREQSEVVGQTTLATIPAGAVLLKPQLVAAGGLTGHSITVEPGKVLVAFPTTDPLTAAGLVSVGDHVDLLATIVSGTGETARTTQTTIQDLEVVQVLGPTKEVPNQARALAFVVDHQVALFLKFLRDNQALVEVAVRSRSESKVVTTEPVNIQVVQETFGFKK